MEDNKEFQDIGGEPTKNMLQPLFEKEDLKQAYYQGLMDGGKGIKPELGTFEDWYKWKTNIT